MEFEKEFQETRQLFQKRRNALDKGLADAFMLLRMPFDSPEAKQLNKEIFETIYFAAMETSMELAIVEGPYETFKGSPASKGFFQFDMWGVTPDSGRYDWYELKQKVKKNGIRNSLLVAPMPTASTSQILGNNECLCLRIASIIIFEPLQ